MLFLKLCFFLICHCIMMSFILGTLTQNEMVFRRLHLGTVAYGMDSMDEVQSHVFSAYTQVDRNTREWLKVQSVVQDTDRKKREEFHLLGAKITVFFRAISACDYCLVECFLTFDDTLCPPLTPEVSEAGNGISPQAKHWLGFFNGATINPWNSQPF